ncbi:sulfatase [Pontiellaceae bacterium B1224]|nr:sulfatase [Pontiellaceae bacterium B1224]
MRKPFMSLFISTAAVFNAMASTPHPNILLICIDDLRPELASFGADYIHSPNIDRLAEAGRPFFHHYVNAPSCGPSRCTLLTGRYGAAGNNALFLRATAFEKDPDAIPPSMPEWFRKNGYTTVSVGKVSHHPGGRGGPDWNDDAAIELPNAWDRHLMPCGKWETPKGAMHGLANGEVRKKAGDMDVFQSLEGPDTIYPDGLIADEGMKQLAELVKADKPFFLAIGLIKPHLPFGAPQKYLDLYAGIELPPVPHPEKPDGITTWHGSGEFMNYNRWEKDPRTDEQFSENVRRHYAACVSYADKHVGDIIARLKQTGADKNTIIVVWGDHGWHLGEHSIWGKHSLFEEALLSPLIIQFPDIGKPGIPSDAVVETLDLFPTLCVLSKVPMPEFVQGVSLVPMLENPDAPGHSALGYKQDTFTLRTAQYRIIQHKDGNIELYDHATPEGETRNIAAENPALVAELIEKLNVKKP